ncbi:hypothetical protein [Lactococcus lactis]|uniref:hypothetical protein n=1 Tax=Lactococcus lactis TaxID=1358 RepID=UPI0022E44F84|nr:hypothetical protein [Lactococcus lactis]
MSTDTATLLLGFLKQTFSGFSPSSSTLANDLLKNATIPMATWLVIFLLFYEMVNKGMRLAEGGGGSSFTIYLPIFFKWIITLAVIVNIQPLFIMIDSIASQLTTNLIAVAAKNTAYADAQKISLNFSGGIWVILFQFIVMIVNFFMAIIANVSIILLIALRNFEMMVLYVLAPMAMVALATEKLSSGGIAYFKTWGAYALQTTVIAVIIVIFPVFLNDYNSMMDGSNGNVIVTLVNGLIPGGAGGAVTGIANAVGSIILNIMYIIAIYKSLGIAKKITGTGG